MDDEIDYDCQNVDVDDDDAMTTTTAATTTKSPLLLLLEDLREEKLGAAVVDAITEKYKKQKMQAILEHVSEFPKGLRASIQSTAAASDLPEVFLHKVYESVKALFLGVASSNDGSSSSSSSDDDDARLVWHGLDDTVDTEDEAELLVRLFPNVLSERKTMRVSVQIGKRETQEACLHPIHLLLFHARAVSFVPLLARLELELSSKESETNHKSTTDRAPNYAPKNIAKLLLSHRIAQIPNNNETTQPQGAGGSSREDLDEASLRALIRLRAMGLVTNEDLGDLLLWLLTEANHRETEFIERRLRLLVQWDPTLLAKCGKTGSSPPNLFFVIFGYTRLFARPAFCLRIFRLAFELGMVHYPHELGFLFHKYPFHLKSSFQDFSWTYGTNKVAAIVHDVLRTTLGARSINNNDDPTQRTLQSWVMVAATNRRIDLDGLYTLLRFDPLAMIPATAAVAAGEPGNNRSPVQFTPPRHCAVGTDPMQLRANAASTSATTVEHVLC